MKTKYFIARNKQYYMDYTKEEIYAMIDNYNPATFIPFLQILDYPYIEEVWVQKLKTYGAQGRIFGRYCATMRLWSYRDFSFSDSDWLNEVRKR